MRRKDCFKVFKKTCRCGFAMNVNGPSFRPCGELKINGVKSLDNIKCEIGKFKDFSTRCAAVEMTTTRGAKTKNPQA